MNINFKKILFAGVFSVLLPTICDNQLLISPSYAFNFEDVFKKTVQTVKQYTVDELEKVLDGPEQQTPSRPETKDNSYVYEIQQELYRLQYLNDNPDGLMGPKTRSAIKRFQADNNLDVTGVPNQQLLYVLQETGKLGTNAVVQNKPVGSASVVLNNTSVSSPQRMEESLVIDSMNIPGEQRRFLLGLVLKRYPKEKENEEFLKAMVVNEPDVIRAKYFGGNTWLGNNFFEKEDAQRAYLNERLEGYLKSLPELPLNYTNLTKVQISDYQERKGGFPIGNPRFGPEMRLDRILISPEVNWDIPELIPAKKTEGRQFLEKVERLSDVNSNKQIRWKDFYYATTVQLRDILPQKNRLGLTEYQLKVVPVSMGVYTDKGLTKLLHDFPVGQSMEDSMQLAQKNTGFSSLLNPPKGCDPISLPFINGYPAFGENLSKELYANHTKSSQQRALTQKETAAKLQYKKNLGKYLDLLALADNQEELDVYNIEESVRELASKSPLPSPTDRKVQQSLNTKAKFLSNEVRSDFVQSISDWSGAVSFKGQNSFEKQNSIIGLHESLSLEQLSDWGKKLSRRILYTAEVDLQEYDRNRGGFYLKNRYENNGLCLSPNCFINSADAVRLLQPDTSNYSAPRFLPMGEQQAKALTSRLEQTSGSNLHRTYMVWTIDLLSQKIGKPIAFKPVSVELYFDKSLQEKLYSFTSSNEASSGHSIAEQNNNGRNAQKSSFSDLQSPPQGIKSIDLPVIQGVPSYMPVVREYTSHQDQYIWENTVPGAFRNYINLSVLATNPDKFFFDQSNQEAVHKKWTNFLTDMEKKRFIEPQRRSDGKILYDEYTGHMRFEKNWVGATPFDQIDTAKTFYDQYKPTLTQWGQKIFKKPAQIQLIQPVKISQYNFGRMEFSIQETGGSVRDLLHSKYWSFSYPHLETWPASREEASVANKKMVEQAKTLYMKRNPGAKTFSVPNYFRAYRAITVVLHPSKDTPDNGFVEIAADRLYSDPQLSVKLADFAVDNKKPAMFGKNQDVVEEAGPIHLNAESITLLKFKEKGLPTDSRSLDELMEKRRLLERQHPDECATLFFKPNFPAISDRNPAPSQIRQKFQTWMRSRIDAIGSEMTFELVRKGPKKEQLNSEMTLFTLYRYPEAKKLQNPSEMIIKLDKLDHRDYPQLTVPAGNVSLSASPAMAAGLRPHDVTEMRTLLRYVGKDGSSVILEPISTQLVYQDNVLSERKFSKQLIQEQQQTQQDRKQHLVNKMMQEGGLRYREEKELKNYCTKEEYAELRQKAAKANMKRTSMIYQKKANKKKRKYEEKDRKETAIKAVSSVARQISKSRACQSWKYKSKRDNNLGSPENGKSCYFFWNASESTEFQSNHVINWGIVGKPSSTDWFVIKSEVSLPDCTDGEVVINVQDYRRCEEDYCFEHSVDIIYRPNEGERIFSDS